MPQFRMCNILKCTQNNYVLIPCLLLYSQQCLIYGKRNFIFICHTFAAVTVKMVEIGVHLRKLENKTEVPFFGPPCTSQSRITGH